MTSLKDIYSRLFCFFGRLDGSLYGREDNEKAWGSTIYLLVINMHYDNDDDDDDALNLPLSLCLDHIK